MVNDYFNPNLKCDMLLREIVDDNLLLDRLRGLAHKYNKLYHRIAISSDQLAQLQFDLRIEITNCRHQFHGYKEDTIFDENSNKFRTLHIPALPDRIYESVIMQVVEPAFSNKWTAIPQASITGRGLSSAIRRIKNSIGCVSNKKRNFGLKLDITKYYQSIDHTLLHDVIDRHFQNERTLATNFHQIINSFQPGLPIGTYSSQFLANLFLADLDFLCAHADNDNKCKVTRYMDDIFVACDGYDKVIEMLNVITNWCTEHKLTLHEPVIANFAQNASIQCIGMIFNHQGVFVPDSTKKRIINQHAEVIEHINSNCLTELDMGRIAAMKGWLSNSTEQLFMNQLQLIKLINYIKYNLHGDFTEYDRQWENTMF